MILSKKEYYGSNTRSDQNDYVHRVGSCGRRDDGSAIPVRR